MLESRWWKKTNLNWQVSLSKKQKQKVLNCTCQLIPSLLINLTTLPTQQYPTTMLLKMAGWDLTLGHKQARYLQMSLKALKQFYGTDPWEFLRCRSLKVEQKQLLKP